MRELQQPHRPKTCDECEALAKRRVWDREKHCTPVCWRRRYEDWHWQMWSLWCLVGHGEIIDSKEGRTQYTVDWQAFGAALSVEHPLTEGCEKHELLEAMLLIARELNRSPGEMLLTGRGAGAR